MSLLRTLQEFFADLRQEGLPVTFSQVEDCCQALLLVDWEVEEYFYIALHSTLVKEHSHETAFGHVYERHFRSGGGANVTKPQWNPPVYRAADLIEDVSGYSPDALPVPGMQAVRGGLSQSSRNPLDQSFRLANLDDVRKMEALFPLIAKRLAVRMIKKNHRNDHNIINYRSTMRHSMATGGVPLNIATFKKHKEKPMIIAICDVSGSVMTFSCFALALLSSMQRFFRQLRTFAFIEDLDEITHLLQMGDPLNLRTSVLKGARQVMGVRGYTNYGATFKGFMQRYGDILTSKTSVLIFGDARNNWNNDETWALQEIQKRVKRVYWFNPELESNWPSGDSRMSEYRKFCHTSYSCPSLSKLEQAIGKL